MSILPPHSVEASSSLTIEEKIVVVAEEHGIAPTLLRNLVDCESKFDPQALSETGDRGLVQINKEAWPEVTDEQAYDPDFSLNWAADKIVKGESYKWTCANCYAFAKVKLGKLPKMADIQGNSDYPRKNGLVIIYYGTVKHVAVIETVKEDGVHIIESNYEPNSITRRVLTWDYLKKYNAKFWHPTI